jgi:hypothetical protein
MKTTMNAGSYKVPHINNGKATMVEVKVRPVVNLGKRYPFSSEKQGGKA